MMVPKGALKKLPKVEAPPSEAKPEPPPPPPPPKAHEKMVDLDNEKPEKPPPDAKFLAPEEQPGARGDARHGYQPREGPEG
jgi:hypothetical protein